MQNPINTAALLQFTQLLKSAELTQQKELKMTIQQARLLNIALTEVLTKLSQDYESLFHSLKQASANEVVSIQLDGGVFGEEK
jgi:CTP synthase (UTP-ammonia lyase)